ncbi:hypothetical protein OAE79_02340 [Rhodopirellula sp.]|nr:hypothetical protein [Rhodopirellula sp.]MDB4679156.1 hypothetical protein [Rhodopirellula sp.]
MFRVSMSQEKSEAFARYQYSSQEIVPFLCSGSFGIRIFHGNILDGDLQNGDQISTCKVYGFFKEKMCDSWLADHRTDLERKPIGTSKSHGYPRRDEFSEITMKPSSWKEVFKAISEVTEA